MVNIDTQYEEALHYLYAFIDYSLTRNLRYSAEKFDLSRMARFSQSIGNPQYDYPVIHIAGTKGKGSTGALITNILTCAGYKTGFYSSPHMIDFCERIRIGDRQIPRERLVALVQAIKPYVDKEKELTTFEIMTSLAFQYFSQEKVDFAVIEVGMGGRLDATNVVSPVLSVITSISHDHMKVLGATLEKIAAEKAGIIKPGMPVVVALQKKAAGRVIRETAGKQTAKLINSHEWIKLTKISSSLDGQIFRIEPEKNSSQQISRSMPYGQKLTLPLLGDHQLENARTALTCIMQLENVGYHFSTGSIQKGIETLNWPGRFEILNRDPLLIIDGAHNRDSFRKLERTMAEYLQGREKILIFGASEDKEVELMLNIIRPQVDLLVITQAAHPRALQGSEIQYRARRLGMHSCVTGSVEEALEYALNQYQENSAILAAGSIFIAGAVKEIWGERKARE
jgi:dihydrofolate synthase/folylpolyglutamate synthase